ncbi:MAG: hypothetical protein NTX50_09620 [Candidatus Sumerlaeota bacterium]|nr:hypothetical protein [Candidatus Sumerlaeota bacterium]
MPRPAGSEPLVTSRPAAGESHVTSPAASLEAAPISGFQPLAIGLQTPAPGQQPLSSLPGLSAAQANFLDEAMREALIGRADKVYQAAQRMRQADDRRIAQGQPRTGIADNLLALAAAITPNRQTRRQCQEEARSEGADPFLRDILRRELEGDPLVEFDRLGRQDRWNRAIRPFNSVIRAFVSLFEGNPQALFQIPVDMVFAIPSAGELTERQVKQFALAQRIENDPQLKRIAPPLIFRKAEVWRRQLDKAQIEQDLQLARELDKHNRWREAIDLCKDVQRRDPKNSQAAALALAAEKKQSQAYRRQIGALSLAGNEPWPEAGGGDARTYREALYQVVQIPSLHSQDIPASLAGAMDDVGLSDMAQYLLSVSLDLQGRREEAIEQLGELKEKGGAMAVRAQAWLEDPRYHPSLAIERGRAQLARDRRNFIFFGQISGEDNLYLLASAAAQQSAAGAANVGVLNVINAATRWVGLWFNPGVPASPVMDALASSLREHPGDAGRNEWREELAGLARYMQQEPIAIAQLKAAGELTKEKETELREREASRIFNKVKELEKPAERAPEYRKWLKKWGDLEMASKVRAALEKDEKEIAADFRLRYDDLRKESEPWLALGLPVKSEWLDGDEENRELDKEGVAFYRRAAGRFEMEYRLRDDGQITSTSIAAARYEALRAAWEEREYHAQRRELAREQRQTYYFPVDVEGGAGASGVHAYPQFQRAPETPDLKLYK